MVRILLLLLLEYSLDYRKIEDHIQINNTIKGARVKKSRWHVSKVLCDTGNSPYTLNRVLTSLLVVLPTLQPYRTRYQRPSHKKVHF